MMEEQEQATFVHRVGLGKRKCTAHEPPQPLTQNAIEAFNVAGLPVALACGMVLALG